MALDGITAAAITTELKETLLGGRIDKLHQPLHDEICFTVRNMGAVHKVLVSANSNSPRIHLTETTRENPMTAPLFCMVLRKHIAGGRITNIYQPNFERIIILEIESANEMGDFSKKQLILEIMGKHSNIILTDEYGKILDSIKRITHEKSSVREVLPGKAYVFPPSQDKKNPFLLDKNDFLSSLHHHEGQKIQDFLYKTYTGISPIMASEICFRSALEGSNACGQLTQTQSETLFSTYAALIDDVKNTLFSHEIYYRDNHQVLDFSVLTMMQFKEMKRKEFSSASALLEAFYHERANASVIKQKAYDMHRLIISNIERCVKKKEIQNKTRNDIADMHIWKKKGELITANIYAVSQGMTSFQTIDFYDEAMPEIAISLDPTKTPSENAQKYFTRYNKAKRTLTALAIQEKQNNEELHYLESVLNALESAKDEADLSEIRTELVESGFIRRQVPKKGKQSRPKKAKPLRYVSSDGYDIYVGKSNIQNDELTLRFAESTDLWMHTKEIPGSHVIIRTNGKDTVPAATLEEAANLAAYYSKAKNSSMVPVDYTQKKNVKKPNGAKPGMVIYLTNKTIFITPDEQRVLQMKSEIQEFRKS